MRNLKDWQTASLLFTGMLVFQLFVGEAYELIVRPTHMFLQKDAQNTAQAAVSKIFEAPKNPMIRGANDPWGLASHRLISDEHSGSGIFRIELFDKGANLRATTHGRSAISIQTKREVLAVAQSRKMSTYFRNGAAMDRPHFYAESYVPVKVTDGSLAVAKVYIDEASRFENFASALFHAAAGAAMMVLVAFAVPSFALYFRSRQKRIVDEKVAYLARHDEMTGVLNRHAFLEELNANLEKLAETDECLAVHYIDIDRFKLVNDTLGHHAGDQIIAEVANRLRSTLGRHDLIGRIGGDEFVIAQIGTKHTDLVTNRAERMLSSMSRPLLVDNKEIWSTISVGCSVAPMHSENADDLLRQADLALYRAKSNGRNSHRSYEPYMDDELEERCKLEKLVRDASDREAFELHFQPLVSGDDNSLLGFEALLRLPDGQGRYISPATFIPVAEELGLVSKIGHWVLNKACAVAANWPAHLKVAVNLSPLQFNEAELVSNVEIALQESGLCPSRLELEITEGLLLNNDETIMLRLQELKAVGVAIVMDDFGTGYSSLSYLWQFPFDKIKIDRSFMVAWDRSDENVENILSTIISLGHSLNMVVTAEGVETQSQANLLKGLSCDQLQGYLFARPMTEENASIAIMNDLRSKLSRNKLTADESGKGAAQISEAV